MQSERNKSPLAKTRSTVETILTLRIQITEDGQPRDEIAQAARASIRATLEVIKDSLREIEIKHGVKVRAGYGHLTEFAPAPLDKILV